MGFMQSCLAGAVSPLMGLGSDALMTMGVGMVICTAIALVGVTFATRRLPQA